MWPTSGSFLLLLVLDGFSLLFSEGKLETFLLSIHAPWITTFPVSGGSTCRLACPFYSSACILSTSQEERKLLFRAV